MDFTDELKKTINKQIKEYLDENKMCVMGEVHQTLDASSGREDTKEAKIEFGQTFQRIPAFAAALSVVDLKTSENIAKAQVHNFRVTKSSAEVTIYGKHCSYMRFNWIACLWISKNREWKEI